MCLNKTTPLNIQKDHLQNAKSKKVREVIYENRSRS